MAPAVVLAFFGAASLLVVAWRTIREISRATLQTVEFWMPVAIVFWPLFASLISHRLVDMLPADARFFAMFGPILGLSIVQLIRLIARRVRVGVAGVVLVPLVAAVAVSAALTGQSWQHGALALIALCGVTVAGPGTVRAVTDGTVASIVATACIPAVYAFLAPGSVQSECGNNPTKCDVLGGYIATGVGGGNNALGLTLAIVCGVLVHVLGGWRGAVAGVAIATITLATGARLATAAAVAIALVALLARTSLRWAVAGSGAMAAISLVMAFAPLPDSFLTNRGMLWARARNFISEQPLLGHGLSFWVRDDPPEMHPTYAPHNLWLELLVASGALGCLAVVIGIGIGAWAVRPDQRGLTLSLVTGVVVVGAVEATIMPYRLGPLPVGFLLLVLFLATLGSPRQSLWTQTSTRTKSSDGTAAASSPGR